ncbi:hypothetical protein J41TS12_41430 [Paenibacillus antibioticophila]|uniref:Uncharacterized protein n=1 Tax=Paenibacillus antibioticophila TaxID=1274374 RepID=A0A920CJU2_9BACL|nr:hypothetical protein [Paenibacillus antibioticophila]GIO39282.1 hypothetical protein J41TS12_41430 [Paenibacillus antibioticophila]
MKNKMKMIIDGMTVRFECDGGAWEWLKTKKKLSHLGQKVLNKALDGEVENFYYEAQRDKFVRQYAGCVDEVVTV